MQLAVPTLVRALFFPPSSQPMRRKAGARWGRASSATPLLRLRVAEVLDETPTTRTFVLDASDLRYRAGQHLTLVVDVDGRTERRCYSFSTTPGAGLPAITVRRVEDGRVSRRLHDGVRAGDVLAALPPSGAFTVDTDASRARHYAMVAGGVGITPLLSLAGSILAEEPVSTVSLVFGNRSPREIVLRRRLEELAQAHGDRLKLVLAVDEAEGEWDGLVGPLSGARVLEALGGAVPDLWLLCGPGPMMDGVLAALDEEGVPRDRVAFERFEYADARPSAIPAVEGRLRFAGSGREAAAPAGSTILEAAEKAGVALPSSCRMGGCGACKVKVRGRVVSAEPNCLGEKERVEGYALACCSYADGEVTLPDF